MMLGMERIHFSIIQPHHLIKTDRNLLFSVKMNNTRKINYQYEFAGFMVENPIISTGKAISTFVLIAN